MKNYYIHTDEVKLLESVSEKLYQSKDNLIGKSISWESLTTNYFKADLPSTPIETIYWKRYRIMWIKEINKLLLTNNYPCQLSVMHGMGVVLLSDGKAVSDKISWRFEKLSNNIGSSIDTFNSYIDAFPEEKKILKRCSSMMMDTLHCSLGLIDASRTLSKDMKEKMKSVIKKHLPEIEE